VSLDLQGNGAGNRRELSVPSSKSAYPLSLGKGKRMNSPPFSPSPFAYGEATVTDMHDSASGGSLPVERWNELLTSPGFDI
jgi:hypothetical protein